MRANNFLLKMEDCSIETIIEEGYQHYDADGKLMNSYEDVSVKTEDYGVYLKAFADATIFCAEKDGSRYIFYLDGEDEKTYQLWVKASGDMEEWDRFLNKEEDLV